MLPIFNKLKNVQTEWFEWTPTLACYDATETAALDVRYEQQVGFGCKIKINKEKSIVFIFVAVRGYIDAVSSGNNYAYYHTLQMEERVTIMVVLLGDNLAME